MKPLRVIFSVGVFLLLFVGQQVQATHIMGGDFNYRYLAKDSFEFTIVFYVDCENGDAGAIASDQYAIIGFFNNRTKDFIEKVEIQRNNPIRVSKLNYACVEAPPNACVDRYEYTFRKRIHVGKDGVIAAFQRCCRNHTITNLVDPGSTGMTWLVTIPSTDIVEINSNPVFKASPPNFLCNDAPLVFDHSATDVDGDSLSYELYIPYEGATRDIPRPTQPSNPDYTELSYSSGYGLFNMMGGKEKLKIDPVTGQLTVFPNKVGQYVVGIKVCEYRDNVKIGETLRDYQFNVLDCKVTLVSDFSINPIDCSDSLLVLNNSSKDANEYDWQLLLKDKVLDISNAENPTFKAATKGVYTITLIAKNTNCQDSMKKQIEVGAKRDLNAQFDIDYDTCDPSSVVITNFSDQTPVWFWDIGTGKGFQRNLPTKEIKYSEPGSYTIQLRLSDSSNCADDVLVGKTFTIIPLDTFYSDFIVDFPNPCDPGEIVLTKTDQLLEDWSWTVETKDKTFKNKEQVVINNLKEGTYKVTLMHQKSTMPCALNLDKTKEIAVKPILTGAEYLTLYNVFSPNGDGVNDCFTLDIDGEDCYIIELTIFNRWGERLFYTDNATSECWNGRSTDGDPYPSGTYYGVVNTKHELSDDVQSIPISITLMK